MEQSPAAFVYSIRMNTAVGESRLDALQVTRVTHVHN